MDPVAQLKLRLALQSKKVAPRVTSSVVSEVRSVHDLTLVALRHLLFTHVSRLIAP